MNSVTVRFSVIWFAVPLLIVKLLFFWMVVWLFVPVMWKLSVCLPGLKYLGEVMWIVKFFAFVCGMLWIVCGCVLMCCARNPCIWSCTFSSLPFWKGFSTVSVNFWSCPLTSSRVCCVWNSLSFCCVVSPPPPLPVFPPPPPLPVFPPLVVVVVVVVVVFELTSIWTWSVLFSPSADLALAVSVLVPVGASSAMSMAVVSLWVLPVFSVSQVVFLLFPCVIVQSFGSSRERFPSPAVSFPLLVVSAFIVRLVFPCVTELLCWVIVVCRKGPPVLVVTSNVVCFCVGFAVVFLMVRL